MTGDEAISVDERRQHERQPVRTLVGCRRVGRGGYEENVDSLDVSLGGALLLADRRLGVGDVLHLEFPDDELAIVLPGLVVGVRDAPFKGMHARYVHVAFTSLSPARLAALYRVLDAWSDDPDPA